MNAQVSNTRVFRIQSAKKRPPRRHVKSAVGLSTRPEVEHLYYLYCGILPTITLSHRSEVRRGRFQECDCRAVASSVRSVTSSAIFFEHLRSRVGVSVFNGYGFEHFSGWRLRSLRALAGQTRSANHEEQ